MAPSDPSNQNPPSEILRLRARIAELEKERQILQADNDRLSTVIASIGDEVWFADAQARLALVNPAVVREFHLGGDLRSVESVAASLEVLGPDGRPRPVEEAPLLRALKGEVLNGLEEIVRTPASGELRYREVNAAPVRDASGNIVGSVCVVRDITDNKRAEEQARRSQKTFSELVERAPFGIYVVDSQFRIAHMNASSQDGAFRNVRPLIGRPFNEAMRILWPEPVAAEIISHFRRTLETGEPYYSPTFFNPRNDVEAVEGYEWELHRMTLPDGQYGVICYYFDSTKLRAAEAARRESEARFRQLADSMPQLIWAADDDGSVDYHNANAGAYRAVETTPEGKWLWPELIHPDDLDTTLAAWRAAQANGGYQCEHRVRMADGSYRWHLSRAQRVATDHRRNRWYGSSTDIHDLKEAEIASRESEEKYRGLFNWTGGAIQICELVFDAEGKAVDNVIVEVNPAYEHHSGLRREEVVGRRITEILSFIEQGWFDRYAEVVRTGKPIHFEEYNASLNQWFDVFASHISGNRFFAVFTNITERKRAEEALREGGELLAVDLAALTRMHQLSKSLVEAEQPEPLFQDIMDAAVAIIGADKGTLQLLEGEALRIVAHKGHTPAFLEFFASAESRASVCGEASRIGERVIVEDVETSPLFAGTESLAVLREAGVRAVQSTPLLSRRSALLGILTTQWGVPYVPNEHALWRLDLLARQAADLIENARANAALRESRKELQDIIDGSPGVIFVKDLEGRFITVNRTFERLLGVTMDEVKGKTDYDLITRDRADWYREHDRRIAQSGEAIQIEEVAELADGRSHTLLAYKFPLRTAGGEIYAVCAISTDITDMKQAEEQLRQAQKMESIGILAGGIAHDFNNLLTGIMGNASMMQLDAGPGSQEQLRQIVEASERSAALTRQLLAYAGKGHFRVEDFDVRRLVRSSADLLRASVPKNAELAVDIPQSLPAVHGDSSQIQQVLMNLVINAAEALEGKGDGKVSVTAGTADFEAASAGRTSPKLGRGRCVWIAVEDNGCGMDGQTKARIFEPFYTTKFTGRGLGLAAVHGILGAHNGAITVDSSPGHGSLFTVYLPVSEIEAEPAASAGTLKAGGRAGTVLIVDDEGYVLKLAKAALERLGHRVLLANNGAEALAVLERDPSVDLVVLDIVMPLVGGVEAFNEMRSRWPRLPILIASGYNRSEAQRLGLPEDLPFLEKPYTIQALAAAVASALGMPATP